MRTHKGTANYRYIAPPLATIIIALSLLAGIFIHPYYLLPALSYATAVLAGAFVIGKTFSEKLTLPAVLATMHISWGAGYLTSPRKLIS